MTTKTIPSASTVSAYLKRQGFGIVSTRNREGVRVQRSRFGAAVSVSADLDNEVHARRLTDQLRESLTEGGFEFYSLPDYSSILYITLRKG